MVTKKAPAKKKSTRTKRPTMAQARAIYEGGKRSYATSYAMLIDDVVEGMRAPAKKAGRQVFFDVRWFQLMAPRIRARRSWDSLEDRVKQEMLEALRDAKY